MQKMYKSFSFFILSRLRNGMKFSKVLKLPEVSTDNIQCISRYKFTAIDLHKQCICSVLSEMFFMLMYMYVN